MNINEWTAIREYIAAEIQLEIARHRRKSHSDATGLAEIAALEEQSTRFETVVREGVAK